MGRVAQRGEVPKSTEILPIRGMFAVHRQTGIERRTSAHLVDPFFPLGLNLRALWHLKGSVISFLASIKLLQYPRLATREAMRFVFASCVYCHCGYILTDGSRDETVSRTSENDLDRD